MIYLLGWARLLIWIIRQKRNSLHREQKSFWKQDDGSQIIHCHGMFYALTFSFSKAIISQYAN